MRIEDRRAFLSRLPPRLLGLYLAFCGTRQAALAHSEGESIRLYLNQPRYVGLLKELSSRHRFSIEDLKALFGRAIYREDIPKRFEKPAEALPYERYQRIFVNPPMRDMGREFVARHGELLRAVERAYGVEADVIAAILGVETRFGRRTDAGFRVFDALNTMFVGIPSRRAFARKELIEFVLLCREEGLDPLSVKGSYAGAMGTPQFISSSYRRYAVDDDGDGKRDLWNSERDIFASVANYLKVHGWQQGMPVRIPVRTDGDHPGIRRLLRQGMEGRTTVSALEGMGIVWQADRAPGRKEQEVSLLSYDWQGEERVVALFSNFRTILRYNQAVNYGLVVSDLADIFSRHFSG